jgi:hypothetical protein
MDEEKRAERHVGLKVIHVSLFKKKKKKRKGVKIFP